LEKSDITILKQHLRRIEKSYAQALIPTFMGSGAKLRIASWPLSRHVLATLMTRFCSEGKMGQHQGISGRADR
jgi:hypothetical protein